MSIRDFLLTELYKPKGLSDLRGDVEGIKKVDNRDTSWRMNLDTYFNKYGFTLLGEPGKYGSVFGNPKYPFVIKVFMKDAAYMKWIEYSMAHKNNPYCPKFKGKMVKISDVFFAIRLEKLTPVKGSAYDEFETARKKKNATDPNLIEILKYFAENRELIDMHTGNVMMRGNQLVIIDPFYNWFDPKKMKFKIDPDKVDLKNLL